MDNKTAVEDVNVLKKSFEEYIQQYIHLTSDLKRAEELIKRKSANRWSERKLASMQRNFMKLSKQVEEVESILDLLQYRLSQNGIEIDVVSKKK
jgi:phage-related minor tail protein